MPTGFPRLALLVAVSLPAALPANAEEAAQVSIERTTNFEVKAPTREIARRIGKAAERLRKEKARLWLDEELPAWSRRCPLEVKINPRRSSGASTFVFERGRLLGQKIQIEGPLEHLLASVLPHEITHVILAADFRQAVPRWADEGAAVHSESATEQKKYEQQARQILRTPGRAIPLQRLFNLKEYPRDQMAFFAESYSVTHFLLKKKDRKTFLAFVKEGQARSWDQALRRHYGYRNVDRLEDDWVKELRADSQRSASSTTASK